MSYFFYDLVRVEQSRDEFEFQGRIFGWVVRRQWNLHLEKWKNLQSVQFQIDQESNNEIHFSILGIQNNL